MQNFRMIIVVIRYYSYIYIYMFGFIKCQISLYHTSCSFPLLSPSSRFVTFPFFILLPFCFPFPPLSHLLSVAFFTARCFLSLSLSCSSFLFLPPSFLLTRYLFFKVFNNMTLIVLTAFLFSGYLLVVSAETCELLFVYFL